MKKNLKKVYLLFSSLVIGLLHFPFGIAKSAVSHRTVFKVSVDSSGNNTNTTPDENPEMTLTSKSVYDSLHLNLKGLSKEAFEYAKKGFEKLLSEGVDISNSVISIIDFSQPSSKKRLFILDLQHYKLLFNTLVAHGRNTGKEIASYFSNQSQSYQSSPGFYITKETYQGKNGYSLKLEGIERGINDKAYDRGIVIHGAGYVSQSYVDAQGYIGRSQGCPAIPENMTYPVINTIKGGSLIFIYHPSYINKSKLLN